MGGTPKVQKYQKTGGFAQRIRRKEGAESAAAGKVELPLTKVKRRNKEDSHFFCLYLYISDEAPLKFSLPNALVLVVLPSVTTFV